MQRGTARGVVRIIGATLRLFVAIEVNEAVRALAGEACAALARAGVAGRYESVQKLHVTVAFLGRAPDDRLESIVAALHLGWRREEFWLEFDRLGAFPTARRPHVIWLGSSRKSAEFEACARDVRAAYTDLGFTFDHDPQPHVTLCRVKGLGLESLPALTGSARLRVAGLTLFQSIPAGPTTRYEAIARTPRIGETL